MDLQTVSALVSTLADLVDLVRAIAGVATTGVAAWQLRQLVFRTSTPTRFQVGETVEVWSCVQQAWILNAKIVKAPDEDCVIDGYEVPKGALKVEFLEGTTQMIYPEHVKKLVRRAAEPFLPVATAGVEDVTPGIVSPSVPVPPGSADEVKPEIGKPTEDVKPGILSPAVKPGIVWIDKNTKAFETSFLNKEEGICFHGFNDQEPESPWVAYVTQRASDAAKRVAVVIMNRGRKKDAMKIRDYCQANGHEAPQFIVLVPKGTAPEEVRRQWGMPSMQVVAGWDVAARNALAEACKGL